MASWLPAVKVILPYLTQIVTTAIPAFTKKPNTEISQEVIANQISELQTAVTSNAESLKTLATQLEKVVQSLEAGAANAEQELKKAKRLSMVAMICAVTAVVICVTTLTVNYIH